MLIEFGLPSQFRLCGDGAGNVLFERHSAVDAKRFDDLRGFCNGNQFDHEHLQISIREEFWVVRALDCLHLHVALDCIYQKWIARFGLERFFGRGQNLAAPPAGNCSIGQTLQGSFSAVSKPIFARKYAFESSPRDLHNALLCTAL